MSFFDHIYNKKRKMKYGKFSLIIITIENLTNLDQDTKFGTSRLLFI